MKRVTVQDADGSKVKLFPSGGAMVGQTPGPFVWLTVTKLDGVEGVSHLTVGQARRVRDALSAFIRENRRRRG